MTSLQFDSGPVLLQGRQRSAAGYLPPRRGRLAIISSRDELCGIAAYTRALEEQLRNAFDVTVIGLDQFLLRGKHRRLRSLGDAHIAEICAAIADYDAVNLQLEFGTLGLEPRVIERRLRRLVAAAPRISVTFHTVFAIAPLDVGAALQQLLRLNLIGAANVVSTHRRVARLARGPVRTLRHAQRRKPVTVIVHNQRDRRRMQHVGGLREVYDHPLSFLDPDQAAAIRGAASRRDFPLLDAVPPQARLIGAFGFFGRYKGLETAVRALHHLPEDHHLAIFGGVHPNEIKPHQPIDPVIASVFDTGFVDASLAERLSARHPSAAVPLSVGFDGGLRDLLVGHPKDLSRRLHFLGPLGDEAFLRGMAVCDAVVFPYLEVGQSASGPISQALELGCRVIAARTQAFLQFARYHRDMIEFFDIGNHLELAARILARPQYPAAQRRLAYSVDTNRAIYLAANGAAATGAPVAPELA